MQNLYLWLATDYGIPTAFAFLFVPGVCLWFGISRVHDGAPTRAIGRCWRPGSAVWWR